MTTSPNKMSEEIRKQLVKSLSIAQVESVDDNGEAVIEYEADRLMQLITSLIKELVAEAKPSKKHIGDEVAENRSYTGERLFNATIDEYHTNLLKALEEV